MALAQARLRLQDAEAPTTGEGVPGPRRTWSDVPADIRQNLPASAQRFYGGLVEAVTSPIQTAKSFADLAAGGLRAGARAVLPRSVTDALDRLDNPETTARISEVANTVGGEYAKNYGSLEGIRDKIAEDPVGFLSDMSLILTGGAGAATKAGAVGTATTLGRAARLTDPLTPVIAPIQLAGRAAGKAADVAYDMTDPMARAYADAAAGRGPEIVQALRNPNAEFVPGSRPLTSQLAASAGAPEFAAFSRMGEERIASELARRLEDQSIARQSYMQQVSGAPANPVTGQRGAMEAAKEARANQAGPMFARAELDVLPGDAAIERLMARPSMDDAMRRAAKIAAEESRPFSLRPPEAPAPSGLLDAQGRPIPAPPAAPPQYGVLDLQYLKRGIDDLIKDPQSGLGTKERAAVANTRKELLDWIDSQSEAYKAAREGFAAASGPINRMAVGREIQNALTNPLTGEASRASTFASAIENAPRTIKRSTGESRFSYLSDVLTPDDIKVVQDIQKDLMRAEKTERSVTAGRRADIPDITRTATDAAAGAGPQLSLLNRAYTLAQNIYRRLEGKVNREVADQIARDLLDPSATAFQLDRALRREANRAKTVSRIETPFQTTAAALRNPAARGVPQVLNAMNPYEDPFVANAMTPR
jgi:hypothetical protein